MVPEWFNNSTFKFPPPPRALGNAWWGIPLCSLTSIVQSEREIFQRFLRVLGSTARPLWQPQVAASVWRTDSRFNPHAVNLFTSSFQVPLYSFFFFFFLPPLAGKSERREGGWHLRKYENCTGKQKLTVHHNNRVKYSSWAREAKDKKTISTLSESLSIKVVLLIVGWCFLPWWQESFININN